MRSSIRRLGLGLASAAALTLPFGVGCARGGSHSDVAAKPTPAVSGAATKSETLYKRLGGYDALAAVTDDFLDRLMHDSKLARFFTGHSEDSHKRIRQLIVDQLCAATGGPCIYVGRDTKTAHAGLGITEEDWTASVAHLSATLDKFRVGPREKDDVVALLNTLKPDIVEKK